MIAKCRLYAGCLALLAALPWPTLSVALGGQADERRGTENAIILAFDAGALVLALPTERKPLARGDRTWFEATSTSIPPQAIVAGIRFALTDNNDPSQSPRGTDLACAFLCRFLV